MSTLANAATLQACLARLERLTPDSPRQWGRMTPHQMVCHLSDAFRFAHGERPAADVSNLLSRTLIRFVALHTPLKWPHGVATLPEADQEKGGTPPEDWRADCERLAGLMKSFPGLNSFPAHPIFGPLSTREWMAWGYRHTDHHFRQFAV